MKKIDVKECATLLKEYDNYLILSHRHPDGDTLGSAFALKRALDLSGKRSMVRCNDDMADKFAAMLSISMQSLKQLSDTILTSERQRMTTISLLP